MNTTWFIIMYNSAIFNMSKRITVMIEDEVIEKLRILQAKQIKESASAVSFSQVINDVLKKNLKN
jgi:predicted CopG family antitoxin